MYLADLTPFGLSSKTRHVDGSAGGLNLRNRKKGIPVMMPSRA